MLGIRYNRLVVAIILIASGCGTQINTLRKGALLGSTGFGLPPILTSLTLTDASPTNHSPLALNWGVQVNGVTSYCVIENSTDVTTCVWHSLPLPATYTDSAADGPFTVTAFVKNAGGVSDPVTSNTITIDRTAAILASATIGNPNPTNTTTFSLAYGAITNAPYTSYCAQENNTAVATCTWTAGALPATYNVTPTNGSKALSFWLQDAAGNISGRVTTAAVVLNNTIPTVAFTTPASNYANIANVTAFPVAGTCSENGQNVVISGAASATVVCGAGTWSTTVDVSAAAQGGFTLYADTTNTAATPAVQASRTFTKDTVAPTLVFVSPSAGSYINIANNASFPVSGNCSENGRSVVISGAVSATVACAAGAWSTNLDFTAVAPGPVSIYVNHSDAAGNPATQVTRSFTKDVTAPTVAITAPAAGAFVNMANVSAFTVSGICSDNGQNVVLSGAISATVACAAGAWSKTANLTAATDGTITVNANFSDAAGNPAVQATRNFTKDTVAPTIAFVSPSAGAYINAANVTAFTVTGTCSENTRNVVVSGAAAGTVVCAAGSWSISLDMSAAPAGSVSIAVDHTDAAGNPATQITRSFFKDVIPPTVAITAPSAGSFVNSGNVTAFTVSGTCSDNGQNVVLSGAISSTVVCAGNIWSKTADLTASSDGTITVNADFSDAAGNPATQSTRNFTKNTGVPAVAIASPAANSYINVANVSAVTVSGTCSENGQNVVLSGAASGTVVCAAGAWSTTLNFSAAGEGLVTLRADTTSVAGNPAPQNSRNFMKDTVVPTVAIVSPAASSYVNAAQVSSYTVSGTCSENGQNVVISGNATQTVNCLAGGWTANLDFSAAASGNVTIYANHSDAAGNPATQASRTYIKDVTPPTVAITSPAAGSYITAATAAAFTVSGACSENGQNVIISGNASATVVCAALAWTATLNLSAVVDGTITIHADHSDAAGNPAPQSTRTFTKATVIPTVAITSPATNSYVNAAQVSSYTVNGVCSATGQNVVISGAASLTVSCLAGAWTANLDFSVAASGNVTIYANHSDMAGNPATQASRTFIKDVTPPTVAITSPAASSYITAATAAAFTVSGTCSENGQNVSVSGSAPTVTTVCASLAWTTSINASGVADGTITVHADHIDAAGNPAVQATRTFVKDTVVPTVAITAPAAASYINAANVTAFTVSGTCSVNGRNVVISGALSTTTVCASNLWSINLDFSAVVDGPVTINVDHSSAAGNAATQATRGFIKDVTAATLVSLTISNTSPTNNPVYSLTYGTETGTFASYCILENSTAVAGCSWTAGTTLPTSFTVSATENAKALTIWLKDSAGNVSTAVTSTNTVTLMTTAPTLASVTITNSTPTKNSTYSLSFGATTGTPSSYCILENDTTVTNCTYTAYPLPASKVVTATENAKVFSVWLKDAAGNVSTRVDSNSVTYDITPPTLASVMILNATPTPSTGYLLSYGALSEAISKYCINENDTVIAHCTWQTATTLPLSYTVTSTMNAKTLSVWIQDTAGNIQTTAVTSNTVSYSNVLAISPATRTLSTAYSIDSMEGKRSGHIAVMLSTGKILIAGGCLNVNNTGTYYQVSKLYNPTANSWAYTPPMNIPRCWASWVTLSDNRILVAGGQTADNTSTSSAEIYDPTANKWTMTYPMGTARAFSAATVLNSGKVLVSGGYSNTTALANIQSSTEIYDPTNQVWIAGPAMNSKRYFHKSILMPTSGNVVIAGGQITSTTTTATTDLFTPSGNSGTIAATGALTQSRADFSAAPLTAAQSSTGAEAVIVLAGFDGNATYRSSVEVFNGSTWTTKNPLTGARRGAGTVQLADGTIVMMGGQSSSATYLATVSTYLATGSANAGLYTAKASFAVSAMSHNVPVLLSNGRAWTVLGDDTDNTTWFLGYPQTFDPVGNSFDYTTYSALMWQTTDQYDGQHLLLTSGKILSCGSRTGTGTPVLNCEYQDPVGFTSKLTGNFGLAFDRFQAGMAELASGSVIIVGGTNSGSTNMENSADVYNPATNTFTQTALMGSYNFDTQVVAIPSNRVLAVGGYSGASFNSAQAISSNTYIYSVAGNSWTTPGSAALPTATAQHRLVKTPAGGIYIYGGWDGTTVSKALYVWNDATTAWNALTSSSVARRAPGMIYVPGGASGRLIVIGGLTTSGAASYTGSVEQYDIGTNTWSPLASIPSSGGIAEHCLTYSAALGKVFFAVSYNATSLSFGNLMSYSIAGNSWATAITGGMYPNQFGQKANGRNCGTLPDGRLFYSSAYESATIQFVNVATPVPYTATLGDGNYVYSVTAGTGALDGRNVFIPAVPLISATSSTVQVNDGSAQTATGTNSVP